MWLVDVATLRFLDVNQAATVRYGYCREEFLAMELSRIGLPEDASTLRFAIDSPTDRPASPCLLRHRLKSGAIISVQISAQPFPYDGRPARLICAHDVTPLVEPASAFGSSLQSRALQGRTQALEATVAQLRKAQELLAIATCTLNLTTRELVVSDSFYRLLGTTAQQFTPTLDGHLELLHPDDREPMRAGLAAFELAGATHYQARHRVIRPDDGRTLHLMVVGEVHSSAAGSMLTCILQDVTAQLESAQELHKMATLARLAGRTARLGGWRYDVSTGRIDWDSETFAIAGLPPATKLDVDPIIDLYAPEYRARVREVFRNCLKTGEPFNELAEFIDTRQRRMWVRLIGEAEFDQQGRVTVVQGAFQNVDEIIRARHAAEELSRRLVQTLESISDAFFTLDRKWRFTYLNSQAERVLNRDRASLLGKVIWDEFWQAAGTPFQTEYERVMYANETVRFDQDYPPLGTRFRVNAYPVPEGVAVYFSDITNEHRQSELARINDERFQLIAKATNDVVWDWNLVSNTLWWNENLRTLFGYLPTDMKPGRRFWQDCVQPEDRDAVLESLEAAIAGDSSTWTAEYRLVHADGTARTVIRPARCFGPTVLQGRCSACRRTPRSSCWSEA